MDPSPLRRTLAVAVLIIGTTGCPDDPPPSGLLRLHVDRQAASPTLTSLGLRVKQVQLFRSPPPPLSPGQSCSFPGAELLSTTPFDMQLDLTGTGRGKLGDFSAPSGSFVELRLLVERIKARRGDKHVSVKLLSRCREPGDDDDDAVDSDSDDDDDDGTEADDRDDESGDEDDDDGLGVLRLVVPAGKTARIVARRLVETTFLFDPNRDLVPQVKQPQGKPKKNKLDMAVDYTLKVVPFLETFNPVKADTGATVRIVGMGFDEPGLGVEFQSKLSANVLTHGDAFIDVEVPANALIGPLTVKNLVGIGTWVRPFIPARFDRGGLPMSPDDLAACVETAAQYAFAAQVGVHRLTGLQLARGAAGGPTCEVSLYDYDDSALLEASMNFQTGAVFDSRTVPNVNPPLGLTEEIDARALAETGTLAAKLNANAGFMHDPLILQGGGGPCARHRCVQVTYTVYDPPRIDGSTTWEPFRIIAVTTVDLTAQVVVATEVF